MIKKLYDSICTKTEDTEALGAALARDILSSGETKIHVAMYGELGAGKTAFVRGLASVIAPDAKVHSPTYTIVNEYHGGKLPRTLCGKASIRSKLRILTAVDILKFIIRSKIHERSTRNFSS